jgi:hypothetical protein
MSLHHLLHPHPHAGSRRRVAGGRAARAPPRTRAPGARDRRETEGDERGETGAERLHSSDFEERSEPAYLGNILPGAASLPPLPIQTIRDSSTKHTVIFPDDNVPKNNVIPAPKNILDLFDYINFNLVKNDIYNKKSYDRYNKISGFIPG